MCWQHVGFLLVCVVSLILRVLVVLLVQVSHVCLWNMCVCWQHVALLWCMLSLALLMVVVFRFSAAKLLGPVAYSHRHAQGNTIPPTQPPLPMPMPINFHKKHICNKKQYMSRTMTAATLTKVWVACSTYTREIPGQSKSRRP